MTTKDFYKFVENKEVELINSQIMTVTDDGFDIDNVFCDALHNDIYHFFHYFYLDKRLVHLTYRVTDKNGKN